MMTEYETIGDLVAIALIATETGVPVEEIATQMDNDVVIDDLGMRAVPAAIAQRYFEERAAEAEREQQVIDRARQRRPARSTTPAPSGVPAQEGLSAFESMMAQPDYTTLREEAGRPSPSFLDEELAAGRRHLAEQQAAAKARSVERMKSDLSS